MAAVAKLTLTDFRTYAAAHVEPGPGFVLLSGDNGAGKTNLLEAVSLLSPGRGLRGAPLSEMARIGGSGAFAISTSVRPFVPSAVEGRVSTSLDTNAEVGIGTGTLPAAPERRQVRINGAPASVNALGEWLSVLWLTPAMDRLFTGSAGDRRRFLDRLVLALEPGHAHHAARYEAAMRARNKLLADERWDEDWLASLEAKMEEHGREVTLARVRTIKALKSATCALRDDDFPSANLWLDKQAPMELAARLSATRKIDAAARRATHGPNNEDLLVTFVAKDMPAARCSTGEQKALLLNLVLSHAEVVAEKRGAPPILLLDEVAAHLDPKRRAALFDRLEGRGQVWMTATEPSLFDGIAEATHFRVEGGSATPI
jgi:DNA replication and repair protein RecF